MSEDTHELTTPAATKTDEEIQRYHDRERMNIYNQIAAKANIPKRFSGVRCESPTADEKWKRAVEPARDLLCYKPTGQIIVLCGNRGSGKTTMAVQLMHCAMKHKHYFAHYSTLETYLNRIRGYKADLEVIREDFNDPKVLALDEVGKIGDSAWEERQLFHLVNERFNDNKHTIMMCAAQPDGLDAILSPSIRDRIHEDGCVVHLDWPSFRPKL